MPRFLIVNENYLGHATVLKLAKKALEADPEVSFDTLRLDQPTSWLDRVGRYCLGLRFPNRWVRQQNLDFARLRFQWYVASTARRRILAQLARHKYDAIWFHTQTAAFLCRDVMRRIPSLISTDITNAQAACEWNRPETRWTYAPNIWMEQVVFNQATAIATFSDWCRQAVLTEHPKLPPEKIHHLPPGAELADFLAMPVERRAGNKLQLLFVGGDFERKGGPMLLEAFRASARLRETCELHLVTTTPVEAGPGVRVYRDLTPYSPELLTRYREADLFVLPTKNEAYGHVFVEAMAAALPVVASDINAIPEMVRPDKEGLLIPPDAPDALNEALVTLIDNPALRHQMGASGRTRASGEFEAGRCYGNYVSLLKQLAARG